MYNCTCSESPCGAYQMTYLTHLRYVKPSTLRKVPSLSLWNTSSPSSRVNSPGTYSPPSYDDDFLQGVQVGAAASPKMSKSRSGMFYM